MERLRALRCPFIVVVKHLAFLYVLVWALTGSAVLAQQPAATTRTSSFLQFVTNSANSLRVDSREVSPGLPANLKLSDPLFSDSTIVKVPTVFISGDSVGSLLVGLDTLTALKPNKFANGPVLHPQLGQVREIELAQASAVRVFLTSSGEVFLGDDRKVTFLTRVSESFARTGNVAELADVATYLKGFSLTRCSDGRSTIVCTLSTPRVLLNPEGLRDVTIGVELTVKGIHGTPSPSPNTSASRAPPPASPRPFGLHLYRITWPNSSLPKSNPFSGAAPRAVQLPPPPPLSTTLPDFSTENCAEAPLTRIPSFKLSQIKQVALAPFATSGTNLFGPHAPDPLSYFANTQVWASDRTTLVTPAQVTSGMNASIFYGGRSFSTIPSELREGDVLLVVWFDNTAALRAPSLPQRFEVFGRSGFYHVVGGGDAFKAKAIAAFKVASAPASTGGSGGNSDSSHITLTVADITTFTLIDALGAASFANFWPSGCDSAIQHESFAADLRKLVSRNLKPTLARISQCYALPLGQSKGDCACGGILSRVEALSTQKYTPQDDTSAQLALDMYMTASASALSELKDCVSAAHPQLASGLDGIGRALDGFTRRDESTGDMSTQLPPFARACADIRHAAIEAEPGKYKNWSPTGSEAQFIATYALSEEDREWFRRKCICSKAKKELSRILKEARILQSMANQSAKVPSDTLPIAAEHQVAFEDAQRLVQQAPQGLLQDPHVRDVLFAIQRNKCLEPLECGQRDKEREEDIVREARERFIGEYLGTIPESERSKVREALVERYSSTADAVRKRDTEVEDKIAKLICNPESPEVDNSNQCAQFGKPFANSLLSQSGFPEAGDGLDTGLMPDKWKPVLSTAQVDWLDQDYAGVLCSAPPKCEHPDSAIVGKPKEWLLPEETSDALKGLFTISNWYPRKLLRYKTVLKHWRYNDQLTKIRIENVYDKDGRPVIDEKFEFWTKGTFKYYEPLCNVTSCNDALSDSAVKSVLTKDGKATIKVDGEKREIETLGFAIVEHDATKRTYMGGGEYKMESEFCRDPLPLCTDTISGIQDKTYHSAGQTEDWFPEGGNQRVRYSLWHYAKRLCLQQKWCPGVTSGSSSGMVWRYSKPWECKMEPSPDYGKVVSDPSLGPHERAKMQEVMVCTAQLEKLPCPEPVVTPVGTASPGATPPGQGEVSRSSRTPSDSGATLSPTPPPGGDTASGNPTAAPKGATAFNEVLSDADERSLLSDLLAIHPAVAQSSQLAADLGDRGLGIEQVSGTNLFNLRRVFPPIKTTVYDGPALSISKENHLPVSSEDDSQDGGEGGNQQGVDPAGTPRANGTPMVTPTPGSSGAPAESVTIGSLADAVVAAVKKGLGATAEAIGKLFSAVWNRLAAISGQQYERFKGVTVGEVTTGMMEFQRLWDESTLEAQAIVEAEGRYKAPDEKLGDAPREREIQRIANEIFLKKWEAAPVKQEVKAIIIAQVERESLKASEDQAAKQDKALKDAGVDKLISTYSRKLDRLGALMTIADVGTIPKDNDSPAMAERRADALKILEEEGEITHWTTEEYCCPRSYKIAPHFRESDLVKQSSGYATISLDTHALRAEVDVMHARYAEIARSLQTMVAAGTLSLDSYNVSTNTLMQGYQFVNEYVEGKKSAEAMEESMSQLRVAIAIDVGLSLVPVGRVAKYIAGGAKSIELIGLYRTLASSRLVMKIANGARVVGEAAGVSRAVATFGTMAGRLLNNSIVRGAVSGGAQAVIINRYRQKSVGFAQLGVDVALSKDPNQALLQHAESMVSGPNGEDKGLTGAMKESLSESLESLKYGGLAGVGKVGPVFSAMLATWDNLKTDPKTGTSQFNQNLETIFTHWNNATIANARNDTQEMVRQLAHAGIQTALMGEDFVDVIAGARGVVNGGQSGVAPQGATSPSVLAQRSKELGRGISSLLPNNITSIPPPRGVVSDASVKASHVTLTDRALTAIHNNASTVATDLSTQGFTTTLNSAAARTQGNQVNDWATVTVAPHSGDALSPLHGALAQTTSTYTAGSSKPLTVTYNPISWAIPGRSSGFNPIANELTLSSDVGRFAQSGLIPIQDQRALAQAQEIGSIRNGEIPSPLVGEVSYTSDVSGARISHNLHDINLYAANALGHFANAHRLQYSDPTSAGQFFVLGHEYAVKVESLAGDLTRAMSGQPQGVVRHSSPIYSGAGNPNAQSLNINFSGGTSVGVPILSSGSGGGSPFHLSTGTSNQQAGEAITRAIVNHLNGISSEVRQATHVAAQGIDFEFIADRTTGDASLVDPALLPPVGDHTRMSATAPARGGPNPLQLSLEETKTIINGRGSGKTYRRTDHFAVSRTDVANKPKWYISPDGSMHPANPYNMDVTVTGHVGDNNGTKNDTPYLSCTRPSPEIPFGDPTFGEYVIEFDARRFIEDFVAGKLEGIRFNIIPYEHLQSFFRKQLADFLEANGKSASEIAVTIKKLDDLAEMQTLNPAARNRKAVSELFKELKEELFDHPDLQRQFDEFGSAYRHNQAMEEDLLDFPDGVPAEYLKYFKDLGGELRPSSYDEMKTAYEYGRLE